MSESYAVCVSKYIPQNTDSPLKNQRSINSPGIELKGNSQRKIEKLTTQIQKVNSVRKNPQNCQVTQL